MVLESVSVGDPHSSAHNEERAAINELSTLVKSASDRYNAAAQEYAEASQLYQSQNDVLNAKIQDVYTKTNDIASVAVNKALTTVGGITTDEKTAAWGITGTSGRGIDILNADGSLCEAPLKPIRTLGENLAAWGIQGTNGAVVDVIMNDGSLSDTVLNAIIPRITSQIGLDRVTAALKVLNVGTSLTAGVNGTPYPTQLKNVFGLDTYNNGWAGRNSHVLASSWGYLPFLLKNPVTIPTSGSVTIETTWEYGGGVNNVFEISGIQGYLVRVTGTSQTFTPIVYPTNPIPVAAGAQVRRVTPTTDHSDKIVIIEMSRNDPVTMSFGATISHIEDVIDAITKRSLTRKVLLMGEPMSTADPANDIAIRVNRNKALAQAFPGSYVDAFEWLQTDACASYLGVTWTDQDRLNISRGHLPQTLLVKDAGGYDVLHPNGLGNKAIAYRLYSAMQERGWVL